jgi:hypothetical protein
VAAGHAPRRDVHRPRRGRARGAQLLCLWLPRRAGGGTGSSTPRSSTRQEGARGREARRLARVLGCRVHRGPRRRVHGEDPVGPRFGIRKCPAPQQLPGTIQRIEKAMGVGGHIQSQLCRAKSRQTEEIRGARGTAALSGAAHASTAGAHLLDQRARGPRVLLWGSVCHHVKRGGQPASCHLLLSSTARVSCASSSGRARARPRSGAQRAAAPARSASFTRSWSFGFSRSMPTRSACRPCTPWSSPSPVPAAPAGIPACGGGTWMAWSARAGSGHVSRARS